MGQWRAWEARCWPLLRPHTLREAKAGTLARRLARAGASLGLLRDVHGVAATPTMAERAHRLGGWGRHRSQGPGSEQGQRWVERGRAWRPPGRIRGRPTFPLLVDAVAGLCKGEPPDRGGRTQHDSLPVPSTP